MALAPWNPPGVLPRNPHIAAQQRQLLRQELENYEFVDDDKDFVRDLYPGAAEAHAQRYDHVQQYRQLVVDATSVSSMDHPVQGPGCVLSDDATFWSSTGSDDTAREEHITLRLASPLCELRSVSLCFYRAEFQFGEPVYPSNQVSFYVGPSKDRLHRASPRFIVWPTDWRQTFFLLQDVPVGGVLRIVMHGRRQKQLEDMRHYVCLRHVEAHGLELPISAVAGFQDLLRQPSLRLPSPSCLPATALNWRRRRRQRNMAMGDTAQSSEMCYDVEPGTGSLSMDDANDIDEDSDGDRYLPEAQQGDREGEDTSTANTAGGPSRNPQQSASGPDTDQHYHHQVQQQKQRPDKVPRESELQNLTTTPAEAQTTADGDPISVSGAGLLISQATSEALISAGPVPGLFLYAASRVEEALSDDDSEWE
mmetsp:Transcript_15250/g.46066  ORF Transcript_15250/g.46066 Transcript_15250/m.46066 type:complete len:422 (+) Transcript_15250:724-1989(+)